MNAKLVKKLRKRIKPIQVEWLKTLLPEDQAEKVDIKNVDNLLPDETHVFAGKFILTYMSDKWVMKQLKRNPHITTYKELSELHEGI